MYVELKRKWFTDASECKDQAAADGRISIAQVWSVFLILALGSVAGIIAAVLEVVYHNKIFEGGLSAEPAASMSQL